MYGYTGKIAHIDLSSRNVNIEQKDDRFYRTYMGAACIGAYYLLTQLSSGTDPLSSDNMLIFAASPFTGAPGPGLSMHSVMAKSPLTYGIGESQANGSFGPRLKMAGYDALILHGKAARPTYICVDDGEISFHDASHLWGKETAPTQDAITAELGYNDISVAAIGPAGENLVRYASIVNDRVFINNRMGMGAVMGSKNIKAIAVRGTHAVPCADASAILHIYKYFDDNFMTNDINRGTTNSGIASFVEPSDRDGLFSSYNMQSIGFEGSSKINGDIYEKKWGFGGRVHCFGCPAGCKRLLANTAAIGVDPSYGAPSMEAIVDFGNNCGIDDPETILKAHERCRRYGLDTTSCGSSISFAMECFEKGLLTKEDTGGIELRFGNREALLEAIDAIAYRKDIGDVLSQGVQRASQIIDKGSKRFAMHAKGQELPMHEARIKRMLGLGYAVAPTGPDTFVVEHDTDFDFNAPQAVLDQIKALGLLERFDAQYLGPGKVRMFTYLNDVFSFMDALDLCIFAFAPARFLPFDKLVEMAAAITGWNISLWELMKTGERRIAMFRMFNHREGFNAADDDLPERVFEPVLTGRWNGTHYPREQFENAKKLYYEMMGIDEHTGIPNNAKLCELGLTEFIKEE